VLGIVKELQILLLEEVFVSWMCWPGLRLPRLWEILDILEKQLRSSCDR